MKESYGNIKDTSLATAISSSGFKQYWSVTKNQVTKCKDCEFRHVCTDCRAYLENPDDPCAAPLKCGYDPYTCEWQDWSANPLKQQAIVHYGMQSLTKA
jgi:SPASM domain peptide maturase of grasp-with-spasm system